MPTVSKVFARPEVGPEFYETLNRANNYRYVGSEITVLVDHRDSAIDVLESKGFAQLSDRPSSGEADGIGRIILADAQAVPDAVDVLTGEGIASSPHHVYVLGNHTQFGPADAPRSLAGVPPQWATDVLGHIADEPGPIVAIIDTGILADTPFPIDALLEGFDGDPLPGPPGPPGPLAPYVGHGTFVAGRVLQQAPNAQLIMVRPEMLPTLSGDALSVSDDELAIALAWAIAVAGGGADARPAADDAQDFAVAKAGALTPDQVPAVLNLSLSGPVHDPMTPGLSRTRLVLDVWVDTLNTTVIAAAGNEHSDQEQYPGAYEDVICVGACDEFGRIAEFSNYGPWVNLYAPGVDTESWYIDDAQGPLLTVVIAGKSRRKKSEGPWNGYAQWSGTSFAAPYVAGLIAR